MADACVYSFWVPRVLILLEFDIVAALTQPVGNPVSATDGPAQPAYGNPSGTSAYGGQQSTGVYGGVKTEPPRGPYGGSAAPASTPYGGGAPASTGPYGAGGAYGGSSAGQSSAYGGGNQPYNTFANNRPVMRDDGVVTVMPIAELHPYANKWTIKAR